MATSRAQVIGEAQKRLLAAHLLQQFVSQAGGHSQQLGGGAAMQASAQGGPVPPAASAAPPAPPTAQAAGPGMHHQRVLTDAQRQRRTLRQQIDPGLDLRTAHDDSEIAMLRRRGGLPPSGRAASAAQGVEAALARRLARTKIRPS